MRALTVDFSSAGYISIARAYNRGGAQPEASIKRFPSLRTTRPQPPHILPYHPV